MVVDDLLYAASYGTVDEKLLPMFELDGGAGCARLLAGPYREQAPQI